MSNESKVFYEFGPFRLDAVERQLWRGDEEIPLTQKSFDVLSVLLKNYGHLVKKDVFMREVWPGVNVEEKNLTDNISILRQALGDNPHRPIYIKTVPRQGYRFVGEVLVFDEDIEEVVVAEHTRARILIEEEQEEIGTPSGVASVRQSNVRQELPAAPHHATPSRIIKPTLLTVGLMLALGGVLYWQQSHRADSSAVPHPLKPVLKTVPLTTFPDEEMESALSPDGKFVAFAWKGGTSDRINIYVQQVDAGSPQRLTEALAREGRPTWSPDGRYIAFIRASPEAGKSGIYVIPAFGGHERQLLTGVIVGLDWSVDGKSLVYASHSPAQEPFGINILTIESLEVRRLTTPPAGTFGDIHPVFSPDNQTLAFIRYNDDTAELFLMPASGGQVRQLTFDNRRIDGLAWTPDGRQLIFSSNRGGSYNLWSIPAQGGAPMRVEGVGNDAHDPSIARSGNRLTYGHQVVDTNVWRVPLKGGLTTDGAPVKLIASTRRDENPRLSPDGRKIAFQSNRSGALEVWVCDSDGSNQVGLTSFKGPVTGNARWSPDGKQIAFDSRPEGHADIYVISAEGGPVRGITSEQGDNLAPSWSQDGRSLYFGSNRSGSWQIWKAPVEGGEALQVTQHGGYEAVEAPDGQSIYYNKYGMNTVGVFHLPLTGGEEMMVVALPQLDSFGDWTVTREGLYFIHRYDELGKPAAHPSIDFFNFATRRTVTVVPLKQDPTSNPGLSVSLDGRWLIYSNDDFRTLDIMLVENFLASVDSNSVTEDIR